MKILVKCAQCGKEKYVYPAVAKLRENHFCDYKCLGKWNSINKRGKNSSGWKGRVTVRCAYCNTEKEVMQSVYKKSKKHFCNNKCSGAWRSTKIITACDDCGEELSIPLWEFKKIKHHFCNRKCQGRWQSKTRSGENSPSWQGGVMVAVKCSECGVEKEVTLWQYNKCNHHFCNQTCKGKWVSKNMVGENSPSWQGGISLEPYCEIWKDKEYKADIRERDGNKCQNPDCWRKDKRALSIHHIDYNKKNCEPENLITLCGSCNARANSNREWHTEYYRQIMVESGKIRECVLVKESIEK